MPANNPGSGSAAAAATTTNTDNLLLLKNHYDEIKQLYTDCKKNQKVPHEVTEEFLEAGEKYCVALIKNSNDDEAKRVMAEMLAIYPTKFNVTVEQEFQKLKAKVFPNTAPKLTDTKHAEATATPANSATASAVASASSNPAYQSNKMREADTVVIHAKQPVMMGRLNFSTVQQAGASAFTASVQRAALIANKLQQTIDEAPPLQRTDGSPLASAGIDTKHAVDVEQLKKGYESAKQQFKQLKAICPDPKINQDSDEHANFVQAFYNYKMVLDESDAANLQIEFDAVSAKFTLNWLHHRLNHAFQLNYQHQFASAQKILQNLFNLVKHNLEPSKLRTLLLVEIAFHNIKHNFANIPANISIAILNRCKIKNPAYTSEADKLIAVIKRQNPNLYPDEPLKLQRTDGSHSNVSADQKLNGAGPTNNISEIEAALTSGDVLMTQLCLTSLVLLGQIDDAKKYSQQLITSPNFNCKNNLIKADMYFNCALGLVELAGNNPAPKEVQEFLRKAEQLNPKLKAVIAFLKQKHAAQFVGLEPDAKASDAPLVVADAAPTASAAATGSSCFPSDSPLHGRVLRPITVELTTYFGHAAGDVAPESSPTTPGPA